MNLTLTLCNTFICDQISSNVFSLQAFLLDLVIFSIHAELESSFDLSVDEFFSFYCT